MRGVKTVEISIRGAPEEIAALVRATQERQTGENFTPSDEIKKAVAQIIKFSGDVKQLAEILQAKDDKEPEAP